jgi:tetratricopeptide (TPR) repeat protein
VVIMSDDSGQAEKAERRAKAKAAYDKGVDHFEAKRMDAAHDAFTKAIFFDPDWSEPYFRRGTIRQNRGQHEWAIADFTSAIKCDYRSAKSFAKRAVSYSEEGNWEAALNDFTKAIALAPTQPVLYVKRAELLLRFGKAWKALDDTNRAIELEPTRAQAYRLRGLALEKLDDHSGAEASLREAVRLGDYEARRILRQRFGG